MGAAGRPPGVDGLSRLFRRSGACNRRPGRAAHLLALLALVCAGLLAGCAAPTEAPPPALTTELVAARLGMGDVRDFAYSPDGTHLAVASGSGRTYLWDVRKRRFQAVLAPKNAKPVTAVAYATADLLVTASEDGDLRAWDPGLARPAKALGRKGSALSSLAVSPDGRQAFAGTEEGHILTWDFASAQPGKDVAAHTGAVNALVLSPDGATLFSAGADGVVASHKAADLSPAAKSVALQDQGTPVPVLSLAMAVQNAANLYAGFKDNTVRELNASTLAVTRPFTDLGASVTALTAAGPYVAAGGANHRVVVWNPQAGTTAVLSGSHGEVKALAFTRDGRLAASGADKVVTVYNDISPKQPPEPNVEILGHPATISGLAYSPDGSRVASSGGPSVLLWDPTDGSLASVLPAVPHGGLQAVAWSKQGLLASAGEDSRVRLYDAEGKLLGEGLHEGQVNDVAFSPDGKLLASGSWDRTVRLWAVDPTSGLTPGAVLEGHRNAVSAVSFSGDGKFLVSSSWDHTVSVWDVATAARTQRLDGMAGPVFAAAFDPARPLVAAGGWHGQTWFWESATGTAVSQADGQKDVVFVVRFSSDGRGLATGSADRSVQFWDPVAEKPRIIPRQLVGFRAGVGGLAWSPDSRWLAVGTRDGFAYVLPVPQEALPGRAGVAPAASPAPAGPPPASPAIR